MDTEKRYSVTLIKSRPKEYCVYDNEQKINVPDYELGSHNSFRLDYEAENMARVMNKVNELPKTCPLGNLEIIQCGEPRGTCQKCRQVGRYDTNLLRKLESTEGELERLYQKNYSDVPEKVRSLWGKIEGYAKAFGEVCGEGNSGEFSNEENSKEASDLFEKATENLKEEFANWTGWKPVWIEMNESVYILKKESKTDVSHGATLEGYWGFEIKKI